MWNIVWVIKVILIVIISGFLLNWTRRRIGERSGIYCANLILRFSIWVFGRTGVDGNGNNLLNRYPKSRKGLLQPMSAYYGLGDKT
jgi:hypothetical protein